MGRLVLRTLILVVATAGLQALLPETSRDQYPELAAFVRDLQQGAAVAYFGDSVLYNCDNSDKDARSTPEMLRDSTGWQVAAVQHGSYDARVYLGFSRVIAASEQRPRFVVFEANLRSFSPEMDMRPQYQFTHERYLLRWHGNLLMPRLYRPLALLRAFPDVTQAEFLAAPVYDGTRRVGRVADFPYFGHDLRGTLPDETITTRSFVLHYMGALRPDHPRLAASRRRARCWGGQGSRPSST